MDYAWTRLHVPKRKHFEEYNKIVVERYGTENHILPWPSRVVTAYLNNDDVTGGKVLNADVMQKAIVTSLRKDRSVGYQKLASVVTTLKNDTAAGILKRAHLNDPHFKLHNHLLVKALYPYITRLDVKMKGLCCICYTKYMENLVYLDLSFNRIRSLSSLGSLAYLEELNASFNKIETMRGLENLPKLRVLNLRNNFIRNIEGFDRSIWLEILNVSSNRIDSFTSIAYLNKFEQLRLLNLEKNPVCKKDGDRFAFAAVPQVTIYNYLNVTPRQKRQAKIYKNKLYELKEFHFRIETFKQQYPHTKWKQTFPRQFMKQWDKIPNTYVQMLEGDSFFLSQFEEDADGQEMLKLTTIPTKLGKSAREIYEDYRKEFTTVTTQLYIYGLEQYAIRKKETAQFLSLYVGLKRKVETQFRITINKWKDTKTQLMKKIAALMHKVTEEIQKLNNEKSGEDLISEDLESSLKIVDGNVLEIIDMLYGYKKQIMHESSKHTFKKSTREKISYDIGSEPSLYGQLVDEKSFRSNPSSEIFQKQNTSPSQCLKDLSDVASYELLFNDYNKAQGSKTEDFEMFEYETRSNFSQDMFYASRSPDELFNEYRKYFRNKEKFVRNVECNKNETDTHAIDNIIKTLSSIKNVKKDEKPVNIERALNREIELLNKCAEMDSNSRNNENEVRDQRNIMNDDYVNFLLKTPTPSCKNISKDRFCTKKQRIKPTALDEGEIEILDEEELYEFEKWKKQFQKLLEKTIRGKETVDDDEHKKKAVSGKIDTEEVYKKFVRETKEEREYRLLMNPIIRSDPELAEKIFQKPDIDNGKELITNVYDDDVQSMNEDESDIFMYFDDMWEEYDEYEEDCVSIDETDINELFETFGPNFTKKYITKHKKYFNTVCLRRFRTIEVELEEDEEERGDKSIDEADLDVLCQYFMFKRELILMDVEMFKKYIEEAREYLKTASLFDSQGRLKPPQQESEVVEKEEVEEEQMMEEEHLEEEEVEYSFSDFVEPNVSLRCKVDAMTREVTEFLAQLDEDAGYMHYQEYRLHSHLKRFFRTFEFTMKLLVFDIRVEVSKKFDTMREYATNFNRNLGALLSKFLKAQVNKKPYKKHPDLHKILSNEERMDDALNNSYAEAMDVLWETQDEIIDNLDQYYEDMIEQIDEDRITRHKVIFFKLDHSLQLLRDDVKTALKKLNTEHALLNLNSNESELSEFQLHSAPSCPTVSS